MYPGNLAFFHTGHKNSEAIKDPLWHICPHNIGQPTALQGAIEPCFVDYNRHQNSSLKANSTKVFSQGYTDDPSGDGSAHSHQVFVVQIQSHAAREHEAKEVPPQVQCKNMTRPWGSRTSSSSCTFLLPHLLVPSKAASSQCLGETPLRRFSLVINEAWLCDICPRWSCYSMFMT